MGAAIDALLADDEKKRKDQQSAPSGDGGSSYSINPGGGNIDQLLQSSGIKQNNTSSQNQGGNIDALLNDKGQAPTDAYSTKPAAQKKPNPLIQSQQPQQKNIFQNIQSAVGNVFNTGVSTVENWLNPTPVNKTPTQTQQAIANLKMTPDVKKKWKAITSRFLRFLTTPIK